MAANKKELIVGNIASIGEYKSNLKDFILSGENDPVAIIARISKIEKAISEVKRDKSVVDYVLDSLNNNYNGNIASVEDCEISQIEAGVKYDFSECGDPLLASLYNLRDEVDGKIKDREAFLKAIKEHAAIVSEDGEILTIYPPARSSKTTFKITFKK